MALDFWVGSSGVLLDVGLVYDRIWLATVEFAALVLSKLKGLSVLDWRIKIQLKKIAGFRFANKQVGMSAKSVATIVRRLTSWYAHTHLVGHEDIS